MNAFRWSILVISLGLAGCPLVPNDRDMYKDRMPMRQLQTLVLSPVYLPDDLVNPGSYRNPIIFADYSDPDVCRDGNDYFMTASSFSCFPGLPILHSKDLVHWTLIGHALAHYPEPHRAAFKAPQHGAGVYAPAIRCRNGTFYIYFGDPDRGIFMTQASDPRGPWSPLHLVREGKGFIDPCPFWDHDGSAYLVHAYARSRAGINNVLDVFKMTADGKSVVGEGIRVYDGGTDAAAARPNPVPTGGPYTTVEGPKFYRRGEFYYIFAPGGGVAQGYQIVFRSRNIMGPYESRIVLERGRSPVNGPHQGGWVDTPDGAGHWFLHFQELLPYGRITHLQPMRWVDDWPVMGVDNDGNGRGEPVMSQRYPLPVAGQAVPQTSDEFDLSHLGLQWQWWADYEEDWMSLTGRKGHLRLEAVPAAAPQTLLYNRANLLLQKFPGESFTATAKLDVSGLAAGESAGLVLAGKTMSALMCRRMGEGDLRLVRTDFNANVNNGAGGDREVAVAPLASHTLWLRMTVAARGVCTFSFSTDGRHYQVLGPAVTAINAQWIGAKVGLFCNAPAESAVRGHADVEFFHVERLAP